MRLPAALLCATLLLSAQSSPRGTFEGESEVGEASNGALHLDPANQDYRVTGGGSNIWAAKDAFYFVWKKVSSDITLTADVQFQGEGKVAHRKAALMIRQSLDPGAPYADAAVHGDGLTSLQYRSVASGLTNEVRARPEWFGSPELIPSVRQARRIRIERRGNRFTLYAGVPGKPLTASEPATVELSDPVYIGLAVCSHDAAVVETAVFSNLRIE